MAEVCRLLDIDKQRTTAYKASTNAAIERFHRTLYSMIGRMIDENQRDWDSLLLYVMAARFCCGREHFGTFISLLCVFSFFLLICLDVITFAFPCEPRLSSKVTKAEVTDRIQEGRCRHVGTSMLRNG
jgi:hypothetical protein